MRTRVGASGAGVRPKSPITNHQSQITNHKSKSDRPDHLDRSLAIKCLQRRLIGPVVGIDEEDVVAWPGDPTEARLPAKLARHRVELQAIHQGNERVELRVDVV